MEVKEGTWETSRVDGTELFELRAIDIKQENY